MIGGLLALLGWVLNLFRPKGPSKEAVAVGKAAAAETKAACDSASASVSAAIAQAEMDAPKTTEAVVVQLRKGKF